MKKDRLSYFLTHTAIHIVFIIFCAAILIPFLLLISISLSSQKDILTYGYLLIPKRIDLSAYKFILAAPASLLNSYKISIFITVTGTVFGLLMTSMLGYCISRKDYRYRRLLTFYVVFTMLFNGGLVSYYIVMTRYLHLNDSLLSIILPLLVNAYYVIIMRGFMSDIPLAIIESAKIDGASEWSIFFRIIFPISKAALATIGLFIAFNYWNEWFNAMLFINDNNKVPLQLMLVRMLNSIDTLTSNPKAMEQMAQSGFTLQNFPTLTIRMSTAILAIGPMLIIFPFFQKYFVKGLTIGAVKG